MSPETDYLTESQPPADFSLKPAAIDFGTMKTQGALAALLGVIAVFAIYGRTIATGFLPPDIAVVEAISSGNTPNAGWLVFPTALRTMLGGNVDYGWTAIASLTKDFLLYHQHPAGFHVTNLLWLALSAVLTGQIAMQVSSRWGQRLGAALGVWATLLFALSPLNAGIAPILSGRVDLLSQTFLLASIFFYLRGRSLRERGYFTWALFAELAALLTDPRAVFVPVLITLAEFLGIAQPAQSASRQNVWQRLMLVTLFWALLFFVLTISIAAPQATPLARIDLNFAAWLANLRTSQFWQSLLLGWNVPALSQQILNAVGIVLSAIALFALLYKISKSPETGKTVAWLVLWAAAVVVPVDSFHLLPQNQMLWQAGTASPPALMSLAAAPLSILLPFMLLPIGQNLQKRQATILTNIAIVVLSAVAILGSLTLLNDTRPLVEASAEMRQVREAVMLASSQEKGNQLVLASIPPTIGQGAPVPPGQLFSGYLMSIFRPPFMSQDISDRIVGSAGDTADYIWPERFQRLTKLPNTALLLWDEPNKSFVRWQQPHGDANWQFHIGEPTFKSLDIQPPEALAESRDKANVSTSNTSTITPLPNGVRIHPGKNTITIWLPEVNIDPTQADVAAISLLYTSKTGCHTCHESKLKLLWQEQPQGSGKPTTHSAVISQIAFKQYLVWVGRYKDWTLARKISRVGLQFSDGDYLVDLGRMDLINHALVAPAVQISVDGNIHHRGQVDADNKVEVLFAAEPTPGVGGTKVTISSAGANFNPTTEGDIYKIEPSAGSEVANQDYTQTSGRVELPREIFKQPGVHYVRAIALDPNGAEIGLPSEPLSLTIR